MICLTKSFTFPEIENLVNEIAKLEWENLKLELSVAKLQSDMYLLEALKNCELTNLISVK